MRTYLAPVILIMAVLLGLAAAPVLAAAAVKEVPPPAKPGEEFPLHIVSQKLEADQNAGVITFSGQVKATYGENILYSDQLRVYFQKKPEAAKGKGPGSGRAPGRRPGDGRPKPPGGIGRRQDRPHRGPGLGALRPGGPGGHRPDGDLL